MCSILYFQYATYNIFPYFLLLINCKYAYLYLRYYEILIFIKIVKDIGEYLLELIVMKILEFIRREIRINKKKIDLLTDKNQEFLSVIFTYAEKNLKNNNPFQILLLFVLFFLVSWHIFFIIILFFMIESYLKSYDKFDNVLFIYIIPNILTISIVNIFYVIYNIVLY